MKKLICILTWALWLIAIESFAQPVPDLILTAPRPLTISWVNNNPGGAKDSTEIEVSVNDGPFVNVATAFGAGITTYVYSNVTQSPLSDTRYCFQIRDVKGTLFSGYAKSLNCAVVKALPLRDPSSVTISFENATGEIRIVGTGFKVISRE